MKTELIEFDTQKSIQEITGILRSFNCNMQKLQDDPLASADGGPQPVIAILMAGKVGAMEALTHLKLTVAEWGVQVVVYDMGNKRHVELVALGESGLKSALGAYANTGGGLFNANYYSQANQYFRMGNSKYYRDQIAQSLA